MRGISGHLSGFRPPLLPRYAGLSTTLDAIINDRGPLSRLRRGFDHLGLRTQRTLGRTYGLKMATEERQVCTSLKSIYFMLVLDHPLKFCIHFCLGIRKKCIFFTSHARMAITFCLSLRVFILVVFQCKVSRWAIVLCCFNACNWTSIECCV